MAKTWLITGCSAGGIGEGIARAVLERGDNAVVTARAVAKVEGIVADYPETSLAVALDVSDQAGVDAAYAAAVERFGRVDVLVNNAGYCYRSSVEEADPAGVQAMFDANFFGMVAMIKKVLPGMRERRSGAIVNVSSIGAVRTGAASGYYAATKFTASTPARPRPSATCATTSPTRTPATATRTSRSRTSSRRTARSSRQIEGMPLRAPCESEQ